MKKILEKKFERYIELFRKNELYYFFIYRFVGGLGVPFWFTKFNSNFIWYEKIKLFHFKFFWIYTKFFITNTIGAGLNSYIIQAESFSIIELIFTPQIFIPIIMFLGLMILSVMIKKKFFDAYNF